MRRTDWLQNLQTLIHERMNVHYQPGMHDCCLFVADAVFAQTGKDPAQAYRGTYTTYEEAVRILNAHGGIEALMTKTFGEPVGRNCARRGDVVLFNAPNGASTVGICMGNHFVSPGDEKLNNFDISMATKAWRID